MSIIYIKSSNNEYFRIIDWIKDGLRYAIPLAFALIFRYVIGFVLIELYGVSYAINGAVEIYWFDSFWDCLSNIIKYNLMYYFLSAFSYLPITIYDLSIIAFVILVIKNRRSKNDIFISILLLLSPFFLSIIQGNKLPYRCCAPIQYFVTFVAYLLLIDVYESNKKIFNVKLKTIVIALVVFMTLRQSICLHELLALNNQRSENEAFVARQIGYRIYSEFDKDKTVVVCGEYQLGKFINNQIYINSNEFPGKIESMVRDFLLDEKDNDYSRKYIQTNINSHLNWSTDAFHSQEMIKIYLSYYGYDVNTLPYMSDEDEKEYVKIAENESMKPFEIKDMGDYILVYLGPIIDD